MPDQFQEELGKTLWSIVEQLRGSNADDFRDYMLSFPFVKRRLP